MNLRFKIYVVILIAISVIFLTIWLTRKSVPLNAVLAMSGSNRPELVKVLDHYSQKPEDSLKYKAACFLIGNLKWHSGRQITVPNQIWDEFLLEDSLSKTKIASPKDPVIDHYFYIFKLAEKKKHVKAYLQEAVFNDTVKADLNTLTAEFLINTIEGAFQVRNMPWNKNLSFDEFCEFILPYRFNNEPVFDIRQKLRSHFQNLANNDSIANNQVKAASVINQYISNFNWDWDDMNADLPDLGFYNIFYWNNSKLTCSHHLAIEGPILRAVGIPVIEIFTPKWRMNNLGHSWCGMLNKDKAIVPFTPIYQNPGTIRKEHSLNKASKFYMKTFAAQSNSPYYLANTNEPIPDVFTSPCIKDVTSSLVKAHDILLEISETPKGNNLCYFCLFLYGEWHPIGWGIINHKKNTTEFKNIPDGLIGIPCFYENNRMNPCGNLIEARSDGKYNIIAPTDGKTSVHLTRKYPPKAGLKLFNDEVLGATIEASNDRNFTNPAKLFTLTDTLQPYFEDHSFKNQNYYRYYRMTSPSYSLHFAELEFLTDRKGAGVSKAAILPIFDFADTIVKPAFKLNGTLIGDRKDSLAFDHNNLTFTFQKVLTIDFGKPERINRVRILPRNADNGITIADRYELFFWDNEWKSSGEKVAKYNFLQFDNIPAGTIYWLRNRTKGQEEQPFFYKEGKQEFINN
jgi:hypothetical protein